MALDASTAYDTAPLRQLSRTIIFVLFLIVSRATAEPVVTLVTVGPGDAVWEKFGHNMLRVQDADRGLDVCFNWGLFDFDQPNFIRNFVQGRMLYTMAPLKTDRELELYRGQNRRVTFQQLRLSPKQANDLLRRCIVNFQNSPNYRYDYFNDNCSTRVRDMLDATLGGELAKANQGVLMPPPTTYRHEMLRLMRDEFWLSVGMDFAGGPATDKPLDRWALGFLPATVADMTVPYAEPAIEPWQSTRPPPPAVPRTIWPWLLVAGVVGGGVMLCGIRRGGWRRGVGRTAVYSWWLLAGSGGAFMLYMWTATDHAAAHANQNLWHFSPLAWLAFVLHVFRQRTAAAWFTRAMVGMTLVGCVVWATGKVFGGPFAQPNGNFILLSLPLNLVGAWATRPVATLTKPALADEVSA